jgi:hypothetical protein
MTEQEKDINTERQKHNKTETQKDRKTETQKDRNIKRQKDLSTCRKQISERRDEISYNLLACLLINLPVIVFLLPNSN